MKKLLTMALCIALLCVMALPAMADEPISIVYPSYQVGVDGSATYMGGLILRFNEAYAGKYEIVVEEIPGQQDYIEKLKLLNSNDELPVLFDLGADPTLAEMIIADDKLLDLSDVILNDADWMSVLIEESVEFNTVNGKLIAAPAYQDSYSGVWYNKEVFANAGVDEFPTTWDGLLEACEKIKATGVAPIALMTNEDAWTTMLPFCAYIAGQEGGLDFMYQRFPTNYNVPAVEAAAEYVQKLFNYTTVDAIGATYAMAANNFISGKAAMLPNGPWVVMTFYDENTAPAGFADKVGYATWPGGIVLGTVTRYGSGINKDASPEEHECAIAFLKFMTSESEIKQLCFSTGAIAPHVPISEEEIAALPGLFVEAYKALGEYKIICPNFSYMWDTSIVSEALAKEMPFLADGTYTAEEFCTKLTETAQKYVRN